MMLAERHAGCTVWDDGHLPIHFGCLSYSLSTRVLVIRRFEGARAEIAAKHYRVLIPDTDPVEKLVRLVRASQPMETSITVSFMWNYSWPLGTVWPATRGVTTNPIMLAAMTALMDPLEVMKNEGKLHTCVA